MLSYGSIKSTLTNKRRPNHDLECPFNMWKILKIAKGFDPCQFMRVAQAEMGRYYSQMH